MLNEAIQAEDLVLPCLTWTELKDQLRSMAISRAHELMLDHLISAARRTWPRLSPQDRLAEILAIAVMALAPDAVTPSEPTAGRPASPLRRRAVT